MMTGVAVVILEAEAVKLQEPSQGHLNFPLSSPYRLRRCGWLAASLV